MAGSYGEGTVPPWQGGDEVTCGGHGRRRVCVLRVHRGLQHVRTGLVAVSLRWAQSTERPVYRAVVGEQ